MVDPKSQQNRETPDLLPRLKRDNQQSVQETMRRLKASQTSQVSTASGEKTITTASGLPSTREVVRGQKRRLLAYGLVVLASILLLSGLGYYYLSSLSIAPRPSNQTDLTRNTSDYQDINTASDLRAVVENTNSNATNYYQITYNERQEDSEAEFWRQIFNTLGFMADESLIANIDSNLNLILNKEAPNNQQFLLAFKVYDYPNASRSLRDWETQSSSFIFSQNQTGFSQAVDKITDNLNFRVVDDSIAYTIDADNTVLIGSNIATILDYRQDLRLAED